MNQMIASDDLLAWSNCKTRAQLIQWLDESRIAWVPDRKRWPITTSDAINKALHGEAMTSEVRL